MAGVGRSVAHDGYRQSFLALTVFCPDKPDDAMHEGKFGYCEAPRTKGWRSGRPMLRLRELTAKVSATHASPNGSCPSRAGGNRTARAFGQLGIDRKAHDTRTGSLCGLSALMVSILGQITVRQAAAFATRVLEVQRPAAILALKQLHCFAYPGRLRPSAVRT